MPTLSAIRHDPALSAAYKRLIAAGKKPMVAIVAIMRKPSSSSRSTADGPQTIATKNKAVIS